MNALYLFSITIVLGLILATGSAVAQDTPSAAITTEPPAQTEPAATTLPPEPVEKAACGPTALLALAMLPLILKRKNH